PSSRSATGPPGGPRDDPFHCPAMRGNGAAPVLRHTRQRNRPHLVLVCRDRKRHRRSIHRRDTLLLRLAPAHTHLHRPPTTVHNIWPEKRHQCCRRRLRASLMPERRRNLPTIHHGDCIQVMNTMPANSIDAIVTDPPYGLGFMGKKWDG